MIFVPYEDYRHEKPQGGAFGSALQELHAQLSPSSRYVIEMKQNGAIFQMSSVEASNEPSSKI